MSPKKFALLGAMVTAVGATTGYAIASDSAAPPATHQDPPDKVNPAVSQTPSELSSTFSVLGRANPTAADDPTKAGITVPPTIRADGLNFALARRAATSTGSPASIWIVPGDGFVCLMTKVAASAISGFACSKTADAQMQGIQTTLQPPGGATIVAGLVPDGASTASIEDTNGAKTSVKVADNTYAYADSNAPQKVSFTSAKGSASVPVGSGG